MHAKPIRIGGAAALAQRVTYVGELGWELYLEPAWAVQVWDRLMSAGARFGIRPGGYRALDSLRMEKGYRYYGTDLTLLDNPYEAGLGFCVQLDKGEFNGRDALVAAREAGIKRRLHTLAVGSDEYLPIYGGEAVHGPDGVVGRIRSCAYGFTAKKNLAYTYLPKGMGPGAEVQVEVFGKLVSAVVTPDAVISRQGAAG
jgi:4-methylaminobutanoate oxidase (formaldehyde-forming)